MIFIYMKEKKRITAPYISRVLGSSGVGIYSYTNSIVTYFTLFAALGTASYGQREIAMHRNDSKASSKLFWEIEFLSITTTAVEAFQQHPSIDEIYVSCLDGWSAVLEAYAKQFNITKLKRIVTGGATGQESIYNGLKAIKEDNEETKDIVVIIHDGNRPMLPQDVITDNLVKQKLFGSAVTVIPTTEVVFVSKDGEESNVALNREELWRTQTPHSYRFDELWTVHNQAIEDGVINMAASCLLMQKYGYTTYFSKGSEKNIKITTVEDIEIFKALLSAKNDEWIKK